MSIREEKNSNVGSSSLRFSTHSSCMIQFPFLTYDTVLITKFANVPSIIINSIQQNDSYEENAHLDNLLPPVKLI